MTPDPSLWGSMGLGGWLRLLLVLAWGMRDCCKDSSKVEYGKCLVTSKLSVGAGGHSYRHSSRQQSGLHRARMGPSGVYSSATSLRMLTGLSRHLREVVLYMWREDSL